MKTRWIRLYSITAPLFLIQLFSIGSIPEWLAGPKFRAILADVLAQAAIGIVDNALTALVYSFFGTPLPTG